MRGIILTLALIAVAGMAINTTPYFPIALGHEWVYQDSSEAGYDTSRALVSGMTTIHGHETFIVTKRGVEGIDSSFYQVRPEGFYEMFNLYVEMADISIENYPVLFMKNPAEIGERWAAMSIDTSMMVMGFPVDLTIDVIAEFEGFHDLILPIGDMRDCIKITALADWKIDAGALFADSGQDLYSISYYVENVGLVSQTEFDIMGAMMGGSMDATTSKLISYDFSSIEELIDRPEGMELSAFPNPFNSAVTIRLPSADVRRVEIFDVTGRVVETLDVPSGAGFVGWEPSQTAQSGVYFIKAFAPAAEFSTRAVYLK
ncbi:MAG TPA: T9SS type A sorting domain-containing protein [candidate division Zixibacteria bacterium]|nr:T9SS type A sorting domain-containing protein [candidate division Zixibacteria bacterium]